jgi:hypothetical protein
VNTSNITETAAPVHVPGFARAAWIAPTPGLLIPEHYARLKKTMTDEIIRQRGYMSILPDSAEWLVTQGYAPYQRGAGLLIPRWPILSTDFDGRPIPSGSQLRRDVPRTNFGGQGKPRRIVKYETPAKQVSAIDVHPAVRERLRDLRTPLWISEGLIKCDAGASHGLCIVSLQGVWSWLGRDGRGGASAALPDFDALGLKGRVVIVVFDADSREKKSVHGALVRLMSYLTARGSIVRVKELDSGDLEDYYANG